MSNNSSCWMSAAEKVFSSADKTAALLILLLLNAAMVAGNALVIAAVVKHPKLRTVNGLLITSLAVADLALGVLVLPSSIAKETLSTWIFGSTWCHAWLQLDVFLCTASIYNLVMISFDRCMAITKPLAYRVKVTKSRGKLMILVVWVASAVVCLPELFWRHNAPLSGQDLEFLNVSMHCACSPMHNTPSYIIYSALGSFFVPMLLIALMYSKILMVARAANKHIASSYFGINDDASSPRIHRGRCIQTGHCGEITTIPSPKAASPDSGESKDVNFSAHANNNLTVEDAKCCDVEPSPARKHRSVEHAPNFVTDEQLLPPRRKSEGAILGIKRHVHFRFLPMSGSWPKIFRPFRRKQTHHGFRFRTSNGMRTLQRALMVELKAAKTVGVVTGCFFLSWIGFAVCYLLEAMPWCRNQRECIPPMLFSVVFWLGYANSVFNPAIYALFNREFRKAFVNLTSCKKSTVGLSYRETIYTK